MYSVAITNGIQRDCLKMEQGKRPSNNSVSIQQCTLNWLIPLEKFLIRNTSVFLCRQLKDTARAHIHGDERSPLEKCVMYFVSVWIPVNTEGHSDF